MRGKLKAKRGGWWSEKRDEEAKKGIFPKTAHTKETPSSKIRLMGFSL
jgi:hypothetical protein